MASEEEAAAAASLPAENTPTVFDKIMRKEIPANVVFEDDKQKHSETKIGKVVTEMLPGHIGGHRTFLNPFQLVQQRLPAICLNWKEVDFSANDITAVGLKAFDGVLQSNIVLKTLNLSGNRIGDEGAKASALESVITKGGKVKETDVYNLIELLMNQLVKLDAIMVDGDVKLQRRMQKYVETLNLLKIRNFMPSSNGGPQTPKLTERNSAGRNPVPVQHQQKQQPLSQK
ncbi:hypothetical protein IFM89_006853 [Coptis chinensis]|uniref:BAG domain-containing protein n=1 Tax=Coptis chinensis TaxID=261450 RepID=A0A835HWC9_9MAGN|nr:hypothetical protein IFM89_006853 [Coptis chinensis]